MDTKQKILEFLESHGPASGRELRQFLGISRQALSVHLRVLIRTAEVVKTGSTRSARYHLPSEASAPSVVSRQLQNLGLDEDRVFEELGTLLNLSSELRSNVHTLLRYAFTEMLNNAIDHSQAEKSAVRLALDRANVSFEIRDKGIGVFQSIASKLALAGESEALIELLKGKTTTAPAEHSGEGLFFTARAVDRLVLRSHRIRVEWDRDRDDVFVSQPRHIKGTDVRGEIYRSSRRRLEDVFAEFAPEEFGFEFLRTRVHVRLLRRDYVSRSEAKRLLANLEKFREVRIDFHQVESVGQGFADEIFRVFATRHPDISIVPENASPPVMAMLRHAGYSAS